MLMTVDELGSVIKTGFSIASCIPRLIDPRLSSVMAIFDCNPIGNQKHHFSHMKKIVLVLRSCTFMLKTTFLMVHVQVKTAFSIVRLF